MPDLPCDSHSREIFAHGQRLMQRRRQEGPGAADGPATSLGNSGEGGSGAGGGREGGGGEVVGSSVSGGESGGSSSNGGEDGESSSSSSLLAGRPSGELRLVWKSCTVDSEFFDDASPRVDALAREHGWSVLNVRQVGGARGEGRGQLRGKGIVRPSPVLLEGPFAHVLPHLPLPAPPPSPPPGGGSLPAPGAAAYLDPRLGALPAAGLRDLQRSAAQHPVPSTAARSSLMTVMSDEATWPFLCSWLTRPSMISAAQHPCARYSPYISDEG